jgi:hypothetical protein
MLAEGERRGVNLGFTHDLATPQGDNPSIFSVFSKVW